MNEATDIIKRVMNSGSLCEEIATRIRNELGRVVWTPETLASYAPDLTPVTFYGLPVVTFDAIRPCSICGRTIYAFSLHFKPDDDGFYGLNDTCDDCHDAYIAKVEKSKRAERELASALAKAKFESLVKEEYGKLAAKKEAKRRIDAESKTTGNTPFSIP